MRHFSYTFGLTEMQVESLCIFHGKDLAKILAFIFDFGNYKINPFTRTIYSIKRSAEILLFETNFILTKIVSFGPTFETAKKKLKATISVKISAEQIIVTFQCVIREFGHKIGHLYN